MKWNILIHFSEKGNYLPLVLLFIVKLSYDSGLFCSSVTIKGMCHEWSFLPNVLSYFIAISAPPPAPLSLRAGQGWAVAVQEPGLRGACSTNHQWSWSRGGRMLRKAWAVLEPTINAQEALTGQGPH